MCHISCPYATNFISLNMKTCNYIDLVILQAALYDSEIMYRWLEAKSTPILHPTPIQQSLHNTMGELFFEHQILQIFKELGLSKYEVKMLRNRQQTDEIRKKFVSSLMNKFGASFQEAQKSWTFIKSRAPFTYRYSYLSKIVNETLRYEYESRKESQSGHNI